VFSTEMKLRIKSNEDERYYYPDVFVACDAGDRERYSRGSAVLVVEVLSPTTERIDRTEKFEAYKRIPSLCEYGLLAQDAVELELFRRRTEWQREFYQRDNTVTLESVGLTLSVSQLYRDIEFADPALSSTAPRATGGD
jgi:Uma2 family endonuclease